MPRGGARTRSGPPPAEQSRKKDRQAARAEREKETPAPTSAPAQPQTRVIDDGEFLTLPRQARTANPPAWPLIKPTKATPTSKRELELWRMLWRKPQGYAWEQLGMEIQVAVHVRTLVRAEVDDSAIGLINLLRLQTDGLGLSPAGMHMLRWRIARNIAPSSEQSGTPSAAKPSTGRPAPVSVKSRLKLVAGG